MAIAAGWSKTRVATFGRSPLARRMSRWTTFAAAPPPGRHAEIQSTVSDSGTEESSGYMARVGAWLRGLLGSKGEPAAGPAPHARTQSIGPESFADENNDFALTMYGQLRQRPGNLFFSPFSIRTGLGMTQAGARGETAA